MGSERKILTWLACLENYDFTLRVHNIDYEEGALMKILLKNIYDDEVLHLKDVPDKWIRTKFKSYKTLRNVSSQIDALCQEYLIKCHIKKEDLKKIGISYERITQGFELSSRIILLVIYIKPRTVCLEPTVCYRKSSELCYS